MKFNKQIFTILILALLVPLAVNASTHTDEAKEKNTTPVLFSNIKPNVITPWNSKSTSPVIDHTAFVHPMASVIGAVTIGANVMVYPMASVWGDEGMPIFIGKDSNIQDGVVIHGLETIDEQGKLVENNLVVGSDGKKYTVYVGERVSLAHQSQAHCPALIGNDTFIGMQAFVFKAHLGNNCVL